MLSTVCVWNKILNAAPPFPSSNPPFLLAFYFLPVFLPFSLITLRSSFLEYKLPTPYLSLSLLPRYNSGFPLHPSINLSMHPPSLQQPTQRLIPQRERMWGEAFYSVFQLSSVLIELFCNPAPSNQAQPPLSSCLLCSSSVHGNISLIPLCFPSSRG